jgi:hypothetical protein
MRNTTACVLALLAAAACSKNSATEPKQQPEPATATATEPELPPHQVFDSPGAALAKILEQKPRAIGIGEYHQTTGDPKNVRPPLARFSDDMLETLRTGASDLIVETWAEFGACGEVETKVSKEVEVTTERPPDTENAIIAMMMRAQKLGMHPYVLEMNCKDYEGLLDDNQEVDFEKMLLLITNRLAESAEVALSRDGVVAVYGGSTHNDLYPDPSVADFSYAARVRKAAGGSFVELDLYVPELVEGDELLKTEPWYPLLARTSPDHVVLYERDKGSYILLMRKTTP